MQFASQEKPNFLVPKWGGNGSPGRVGGGEPHDDIKEVIVEVSLGLGGHSLRHPVEGVGDAGKGVSSPTI